MEELGIGSRVRHPEFGAGVVIDVKPKTFVIVFFEKGRIEVSRTYNALEVTEAVEPDPDLISLSRVENVLTQIIRRYSDLQETVPLGSRPRHHCGGHPDNVCPGQRRHLNDHTS